MAVFTDTKDREWTLEINMWLVTRVREETGILLTNVVEENQNLFRTLGADLEKFVQVLWVLVQEQAEERQVTGESFGKALGGDAFDAAVMAFREAIVNFSSGSRRRVLKRVLERSDEADKAAAEMAIKEIDQLDVKSLVSTAMKPPSSSPPSVESSPGDSPGTNSG